MSRPRKSTPKASDNNRATNSSQSKRSSKAKAGATGSNAQSPPTNPPYTVHVKEENGVTYFRNLVSGTGGNWQPSPYGGIDVIRQMVGPEKVYPEATPPDDLTNPNAQTNNSTPAGNLPKEGEVPLDPRLIYLADKSGNVLLSYASSNDVQAPLVDGFIVEKEVNGKKKKTSASSPMVTVDDVNKYVEFFGVPSLMNYNAYINLQGAGGKYGNKYLIDRENQPKWYEVTGQGNKASESGNPIGPLGELTVKDLVAWSDQKENMKFPYRYQDFVFLKWWKKIPLNYMITLRRYTFPVLDSVGSSEEAKGKILPEKLQPAATAITFLGEDPGNKISTILGGIEAGLKWKEVKAEVWEVSFNGQPKRPNDPFPSASKGLGFLVGGADATKPEPGGPPPDPYNNGPYANKILGPVTVIDRTQARDRGVNFKHEINLIFEYSARSIGGINSKAALLDILGNLMILTYNEASFWGGMNRYMPQGAGGDIDPFLGGPAGRAAWMKGDVEGFFKALGDQFSKAIENIGDAFNKFLDDPISGLASLAAGGAREYMKLNTSGGKGFMQGIHSLLTGGPVGEWHLTVGNPMNPMMMIGNLVCTNIKIDFNEELGPDDFPTELKATISLAHGMPRDRAGIESMFNKGRGRMYSLPKGYEKNMSSGSMSAIDTSTGGKKPQGQSETNSRNSNGQTRNSAGSVPSRGTPHPWMGDPATVGRVVGYYKQVVGARVASTVNANISHGVKFVHTFL